MISPGPEFGGFVRSRAITAPFNSSDWTASRTDVSPNWYVTWYNTEPRVIASTEGESLDFVDDFLMPEMWKRRTYDEYNPYTAEERFDINADTGFTPPLPVVPTPVEIEIDGNDTVDLSIGTWVILAQSPEAQEAAEYLAGISSTH